MKTGKGGKRSVGFQEHRVLGERADWEALPAVAEEARQLGRRKRREGL